MTAEQRAMIVAAYKAGHSINKIAAMMGKARSTVRYTLVQLNCPRRGHGSKRETHWTDERRAQLHRLWMAGFSANKIGDMMGMSKNAIIGKIHRMKLPSKRAKASSGTQTIEPAPQIPRDPETGTMPSYHMIRPPRRCGITVSTLRFSHCQFPVDDVKPDDMSGYNDSFKCRKPVLEGSPYCVEHHKRCYVQGSSKFKDLV